MIVSIRLTHTLFSNCGYVCNPTKAPAIKITNVMKFVAEETKPLRVFLSGWNTFDFIIVLGSYLLGGGMITMLRLLRLLRVLKLVKAFPQLQVIVTALMVGMASIGFIGVILVLVFYVFAIMAMILFKDNDPWHFGTLHVSMITLFRGATLEDWTDIMYINMYGCDQYGYEAFPQYCTKPKASGALAAIFFVIFCIIGGLVLLTLFIGVVSTSMDEAQQNQKKEMEIEDILIEIQEERNISDADMSLFRQVFALLDVDEDGLLNEDELKMGLEAAGKETTQEELTEMMLQVDEDGSGEIDEGEFVTFMMNLREAREDPAVSGKDSGKHDVGELEKETKVEKSPKASNGSLQIPNFASPGATVHPS